MIKIKLEFDKDMKVLGGYEYGHQTYLKQLKKVFDINSINKLEFPENIRIITSSFVEGLFSELLKNYSPSEIYDKLEFDSEEFRKYFHQGLSI